MKIIRISSFRSQPTIRYYQALQSIRRPRRTQCHRLRCLRLALPTHHSGRARTGIIRCLDDAHSLQNQCPRGLLRPSINQRAHRIQTTNRRGRLLLRVRHSLPTNTAFLVTTPTSRVHSDNLTATPEVLRKH